jgi:hypothetical protein
MTDCGHNFSPPEIDINELCSETSIPPYAFLSTAIEQREDLSRIRRPKLVLFRTLLFLEFLSNTVGRRDLISSQSLWLA